MQSPSLTVELTNAFELTSSLPLIRRDRSLIDISNITSSKETACNGFGSLSWQRSLFELNCKFFFFFNFYNVHIITYSSITVHQRNQLEAPIDNSMLSK